MKFTGRFSNFWLRLATDDANGTKVGETFERKKFTLSWQLSTIIFSNFSSSSLGTSGYLLNAWSSWSQSRLAQSTHLFNRNQLTDKSVTITEILVSANPLSLNGGTRSAFKLHLIIYEFRCKPGTTNTHTHFAIRDSILQGRTYTVIFTFSS